MQKIRTSRARWTSERAQLLRSAFRTSAVRHGGAGAPPLACDTSKARGDGYIIRVWTIEFKDQQYNT
jgi:hypothetical protein